MHPAIIIGTVRSLWTWLWGRYHVPQNVFLFGEIFDIDRGGGVEAYLTLHLFGVKLYTQDYNI